MKCQPESPNVSGEMSNVTIQSFVLVERSVDLERLQK